MDENFRVRVLRPDDLLVLELAFFNLKLDDPKKPAPQLVRIDPQQNAYIVVHLPPQHIAEQAFWESDKESGDNKNSDHVSAPPVQTILSGSSRLAFLVPSTALPLAYSLTTLLEKISGFEPSVTAAVNFGKRGKPGDLPLPEEPANNQTAIEFPYRLYLSPDCDGRWLHAKAAESKGQRVELWHTRLALQTWKEFPVPGGKIVLLPEAVIESQQTVRAVYAKGLPPFPTSPSKIPDDPFLMSVSEFNRYQIVHTTANFKLKSDVFDPAPIQARRLMLSTLGGWADLRGVWQSSPLGIEEWRYRATMGRDHYVSIVDTGFLYPFGHRVSRITITERKFHPPGVDDAPEGNVAYLRQRMYLVVREPEKSYAGNRQQRGSMMPFKTVRITTLVTPNLDNPTNQPSTPGGPTPGPTFFWPQVGGQNFLFHIVATDFLGQVTEFTMPLLFIHLLHNTDAGQMNKLISATDKGEIARLQQCPIAGQRVAFAGAAAAANVLNSTDNLSVQSLNFSAALNPGGVSASGPSFFPYVSGARVTLPALSMWLGESGTADVKYFADFQDHDNDATNPGKVVLEMIKPVPLDFRERGDKAGALVKPNMAVRALSRKYGLVGDAVSVSKEIFSKDKFFKRDDLGGTLKAPLQAASALAPQAPGDSVDEFLPYLLGGINLLALLPDNVNDPNGTTGLTPKMTTVSDAQGTRVQMVWKVNNWLSDPLNIFSTLGKDSRLTLTTEIVKPTGEATVQTNVNCKIENFRLTLCKLVSLTFKVMDFTSKSGSKPDVDIQIAKDSVSNLPLTFEGPLAFINTIAAYVPLDGFSDPPSLDVTSEGLTAGYSLTLPPIAVGVFSLRNVNLGGLLRIPFIGDPMSLTLNFCRRDAKFMLTVGPLGGGGFFEMTVTTKGLQSFEVGLEAGAGIAVNFGVASGAVCAMLGINFRYSKDQVELDAYFRIYGAVDVLGLITASIELRMDLRWDETRGVLTGEAQISVEIDLFLFSKTVTISCTKTFAGGSKGAQSLLPTAALGAPPLPAAPLTTHISFGDVFTSNDDWIIYQAAFA
ncbi:MAG: hypothetical protein U0Y68_02525 [Blastocatellia bacterium]